MTPTRAMRGARIALVPIICLALVVAAAAGCGAGPTSTPDPTGAPSTPTASEPSASAETPPPETGEPTPTEEPTPTDEPTVEPTDEPTPVPTPTRTPGGADACTGNAENRAFYEAVAAQVAWAVFCPVLPSGWFVDTGSFRLAAGGKLEISYKGPGGRRLEIREGAYCVGQDDCPPGGADAGPAPFGYLPGRLLEGGGTWLVVVEDVENAGVDWEAKGIGMDGPTLAGLTAEFTLVGE